MADKKEVEETGKKKLVLVLEVGCFRPRVCELRSKTTTTITESREHALGVHADTRHE